MVELVLVKCREGSRKVVERAAYDANVVDVSEVRSEGRLGGRVCEVTREVCPRGAAA